MISKDQIQELSKRLAIDEFTIIREYIQLVFLSIFYNAKESHKVYFKGGTAIRLLMKSGRFSEDLNFTSGVSVKELDEVVRETVKKVNLIVPGITLKKTDEGKSSYAGVLSYKSENMKHPLNIHIDFSLREKPETSKQTVIESEFPVAGSPVVRHMDWHELLAEKIRAFVVRSKGRDMYDLWFMLSKGVDLDWAMINRKTRMYNLETTLGDVMGRIEEFDDKKLKNDLGKFLPAYDRNIVEHLKALTMSQLASRQSFTIATSKNIDHVKIPGGSYARGEKLVYNLKKTKITGIERRDENMIAVEITTEDGGRRTGHIRARTRNGVRELDMIESNARSFTGNSYHDLIHHQFSGKEMVDF